MSTAVTDPVLVLPEGWLIGDLTRLRLGRILAAQPADVVGMVARPGDPPAGASYLSHAERMAVRSTRDLVPVDGHRVAGAALLRADQPFSVEGDEVVIEGGRLVADLGSVAHDPWRPFGRTDHADPDGRSPFPYRPLVLLIGLEQDALLADWARTVANDLVRAGVEGRLAVPAPTEGLHLTVPALPSAITVGALTPDVLVALDPDALEQATGWLDAAGNRSTVTVLLTPGTEAEPELVSWRIGEAQGRLRARIGRGTKGDVLADLARRLSTGPVPVGPDDAPTRPDGQRLLHPRKALARTPTGPPLALHALVDASAAHTVRRWEGLFGHIAPPAHTSIEPITGGLSPGAMTADVVVIAATAADRTLAALVEARRAAGRQTIIDVPAAHLTSPELDHLVITAGLAVASDDHRRDQLVADERVRGFTLPDLLPQKRFAELTTIGDEPTPGPRTTIGCDARDASPEAQQAVRDALAEVLDRGSHLDLRLLATEPGPLTELLGRGAAGLTTAPPRPREQTGWLAGIVVTDRPADRPWLDLVETSLIGVPVACPEGHPAAREGLVPASMLVADPTRTESWSALLDHLLNSPGVWERRSRDATATASALYGPASAAALIDRFLGWLREGGRR